jgi:hypothetical protein
VQALLRQLDFHGQELRIIDAELGRVALQSPEVRRLMTIPGVDATIALSIVAAVGDFRFRRPEQLVSYLGLNPQVRQSGGQPASHGRITTQGRAHARGMLVEAAWVAVKTPGSLRAFFERVRSRRGMQVAVVATARKLACLCWTMIERGEDYASARLSLTEKKLRKLELRAALPSRRGQKGKASAYNLKGSAGASASSPSRPSAHTANSSPTGKQKRLRRGEGRARPPPTGRDSQGPLCGAGCAAGLSPRSCASLRGRPRPHQSVTPADSRPRTTSPSDDASARPKSARRARRRQNRSHRRRSAALREPTATDSSPENRPIRPLDP